MLEFMTFGCFVYKNKSSTIGYYLTGKTTVGGSGLDELVIWMGLGLSFLMLCQASGFFAYNDGRVDS